jgi:hypothetical protein
MDTPIDGRVTGGRIGGYARAAKYDMKEAMAPALRGGFAKFEREVDPDGMLAREERDRRAKAARSAHMARLAHRRHRAERLRREAAAEETAAAAMAAELAEDVKTAV